MPPCFYTVLGSSKVSDEQKAMAAAHFSKPPQDKISVSKGLLHDGFFLLLPFSR